MDFLLKKLEIKESQLVSILETEISKNDLLRDAKIRSKKIIENLKKRKQRQYLYQKQLNWKNRKDDFLCRNQECGVKEIVMIFYNIINSRM